LELLPVNLAIQRSKGSAFTNSFVAGVYRDTRMGLEELRATRRARLKKKHDAIGAAKGAVAADIARLQALAALAAKRQVDRQRRRYEAMLFRGALVLQSVYRKRRARVRAAGPPTWHVLIIQERGLPWSERVHVDALLVTCSACLRALPRISWSWRGGGGPGLSKTERRARSKAACSSFWPTSGRLPGSEGNPLFEWCLARVVLKPPHILPMLLAGTQCARTRRLARSGRKRSAVTTRASRPRF
jgi:hypothetical protein